MTLGLRFLGLRQPRVRAKFRLRVLTTTLRKQNQQFTSVCNGNRCLLCGVPVFVCLPLVPVFLLYM